MAVIALALLLVVWGVANGKTEQSQLSIDAMIEQLDDDEIHALVMGAAKGVEAANFALEERHSTPLYCEPALSKMSGAEYTDMFVTFVRRHPEHGKAKISIFAWVMLLALQDAYPCRR
ncbi:hypothetical protein [Rhizobium lentis]|uniref:hypothetical protein n=1 Tax=Rhizobium lentis TaxID=1138194 RepID=UPI001C8357C1|nr:hypothetical protein [Rhizobium lentis]MBX5047730.1 hypothetical protein [Rhizobium lentis]MBX5062397.1 hypothetical protein [Rhizobium lentis]